MSKHKYVFGNMNSCLILIILAFIQLGICSNLSNYTHHDSCSMCTINLFRKKRAVSEYRRWRANSETTSEFIVKVLDDELTTPKPVLAINIQPVTKRGEKIIIGGVVIPPKTISHTPDQTEDYTRFIPPTPTPATRIDDLYLAPTSTSILGPLLEIPHIEPNRRNPQRDESPPASPQFLTRSTSFYANQFAPIAPVAFSRRSTNSPLRPTLTTISHTSQESMQFPIGPSRTSVIPVATRTEAQPEYDNGDHKVAQNFPEEDHSTIILARTSLQTAYNLKRTSTSDLSLDIDDENHDNNEISYEENETSDKESRKSNVKATEKLVQDTDALYNLFFYGDDDSENISKKDELDQIDNYYDKEKSYDTINISSENLNKAEPPKIRNFTKPTTVTYTNNVDVNEISIKPIKEVINIVSNTTKGRLRGEQKKTCNLLKLRQLNFNSPRTLPEIVSQLKHWAENSPLAKWEDITSGNLTNMENPIYMMSIDDPSSGQIISAKQTVMIIAGIQGRDHHAVAAAMYVLYQLIERSEAHTDLLTKYRFWIIPVFNPDGYDYSMTFPHRREWMKNLRQNWEICKSRSSCAGCESHGLRCTVQSCYGVNLDRNFEYQWIPTEELRAEHPCGALYAGARQLSEAETWALTNFLHEQSTPVFTFIAFKEGEVLGVMYPYSHTRKLRALDHVYRQRATRAASAAYSISGRPYVAGQASEFLPLYAGGIEDWVDGHVGIDNTYTIMMFRPADSYNTKLITERVVHEAYAAMDTLLLQSVETGPSAAVVLKKNDGTSKMLPRSPFISLIDVIFTILFNRLVKTLIINT